MIPNAAEVLSGYAFLARRHRLSVPASERAVTAALDTARTLAADREEDEPAALLFAFASYRRAFPEAWRLMAGILAVGQARSSGYQLSATPADFDQLLSAVMHHEAGFVDVRAWVALRLRPLAADR